MPRAYLFEQAALNEYPTNLGSADAEYIVTAEDGMDYVVKTTHKHPSIPFSEWIGHSLADACGIPTPQFTVIKLMNGTMGFGSQWDSSAVDRHGVLTKVTTVPVPGPQSLARMFSAIYALDLVLYNCDRHLGNYFFVQTNKGVAVKAYDFSRALFFNAWPLPSLPMDKHCNTVACYSSLRVSYPFDIAAADQVLKQISSIPKLRVEEWIGQIPEDWISTASRTKFTTWWESNLPSLLVDVSEGLRDGRYL